MNRICATMMITFLLSVSAMPVGADETKDHICFRALDADRDGLVTLAEFEKHYGKDEARFKAADTDQDGNLTHDEYHELLGHGS